MCWARTTWRTSSTRPSTGAGSTNERPAGRCSAGLKDLPEPLVNVKLKGEEADFHWPAHTLVVEIDGPGHERAKTKRDDARKEAEWRSAGYTVLRFRDDEVGPSTLSALRSQGLLQPRAWGPA